MQFAAARPRSPLPNPKGRRRTWMAAGCKTKVEAGTGVQYDYEGCSGCEWDLNKEQSNRRKHRVRFAVACCVFDDPHRVIEPDHGDYAEERFVATGRVGPVVLVVAFTVRAGRERIISARRASRQEERTYYEGIF